MAIDTAEKRKSISGIPLLLPGVTPKAAPDSEWRAEAGWSYSGITYQEEAIPTIIPRLWMYQEFIEQPEVIFNRIPTRIGFHTDDDVSVRDTSPEIGFKGK